MTQTLQTKPPKQRAGVLERTADFFTQMMARWLPDPLAIAVLLTILVMALAMGFQGTGPLEAIDYWGNGFWDLLAFSMQMTVVLLPGTFWREPRLLMQSSTDSPVLLHPHALQSSHLPWLRWPRPG